MKKKIISLVKNSYTKFFVFGVTLAFIVSLGLSAAFAQTGFDNYTFVQSNNGLINRIGSLSIHEGHTASWIDPVGWGTPSYSGKKTCLTTVKDLPKGEVESCLDVNGIGAFSKIITLDIPTFIVDTLLVNKNADFSATAGLPGGLIIDDDPNENNESILAAGLQYTNASGDFVPRDLTSQRNLCADKTTGELYPCGGTISYSCTGATPDHAVMCQGSDSGLTADVEKTLVIACNTDTKCEYTCISGYHYNSSSKTCVVDDTYHWDTGDWGQCSQATQDTCSGHWYEADPNGSCTGNGTYTVNNETEYRCDGSYAVNPPMQLDTVDTPSECEAVQNNIESCNGSGVPADCDDVNGCTCSNVSGSCLWPMITHNCSDNQQNQSACESQNNACTWIPAGNPVKTRTVTCKDQNGNPVDNQYCVNAGLTPDIDVDNDGVPDTTTTDGCGNNNSNNNCIFTADFADIAPAARAYEGQFSGCSWNSTSWHNDAVYTCAISATSEADCKSKVADLCYEKLDSPDIPGTNCTLVGGGSCDYAYDGSYDGGSNNNGYTVNFDHFVKDQSLGYCIFRYDSGDIDGVEFMYSSFNN